MTTPLLKPSCSQAEIDAVSAVLRSGWWGNGPKCAEFERRIAELYGYQYAVTVNSATAALHLALLANGIGPGDEVILPALTFVSTALAVKYVGARPVFADVNPETLTMDPEKAWKLVSKHTGAFVYVDYAGYPALNITSGDYPVIQDAAHSCGGLGYGDAICLSFHPVKNIATGDGGAVLTDLESEYEQMKRLRWCGIDKSTFDRVEQPGYGWDYEVTEVGYKCHWNDIQAAIGLVQLDRMGDLLGRRRLIANIYSTELDDLPGVTLPPDHERHTWHLYPLRVPEHKRDKVIRALLQYGYSAGVHYKPLTHYQVFKQETPAVTEREWRRLVSLPIYYDLEEAQVYEVCEIVREVLHA